MTTAVMTPTPATSASAALDPEWIDARSRELDGALDTAVAGCLKDKGFPQLATAQSKPRSEAPARRPAVGVSLLEMGPTTVEEADRYGLLGVGAAFEDPSRATVESTMPAYDDALTACIDDVVPAAAAAFTTLGQWRELADEGRRQVLDAAEPAVRRALERRVSCLRSNGYPQVDVAAFLSDDLAQALAELGISPGTRRGGLPEPDPLPPGRLRVLPAAPPSRYEPTAAEQALGRAFVECAERTGFRQAVRAAVHPAVGDWTRAHAGELGLFATRIEGLQRALSEREDDNS